MGKNQSPMGKNQKKEKFDYFDAFEEQARVATKEADLLLEAIDGYTTAEELEPLLERAHEIENEGDELNGAILRSVATDFLTPIDREDIIDLADRLDAVTDRIESVIQHIYMFDAHFIHHDAKDFAQLIKKSCEALDAAMGDFRNFKKSKQFKQLILDVSAYEEEADRLHLVVVRKLYTHDADKPMRVQVWTQLFDRMESCCDACKAVGVTMNTIMLKNV